MHGSTTILVPLSSNTTEFLSHLNLDMVLKEKKHFPLIFLLLVCPIQIRKSRKVDIVQVHISTT